MGRCRFRPLGYRIGLVFVVVGCLLVALGFGFPTWLRLSRRSTQGLWHVCGGDWGSCCHLPRLGVLVICVRGLLGASLVLYLFSFTMALRENCCSPNFYTCCLAGRKTEVFAFLAELLGISGMLLFSVDEYETRGDFSRLWWAHALCDFGLALSLLGSIMMACSQHSLSPVPKTPRGRMAAKPQGYQSLANNSHHNHHGRASTAGESQASPFQGRTGSRVSGPIPSPAAVAAITAAVSPRQQRLGSGVTSLPTSPLHRKLSSPASCSALDPLASPARRRKSSAQSCHFAGVHNQGKHPPVFFNQQMDDWRMQQSATWSEDMRAEDAGTWTREMLRQHHEQQQQQHGSPQHAGGTWGSAVERERSWTHNVHCDRRGAGCGEQYNNSSSNNSPTYMRTPPPKSYSEYHTAARARLPPSASYSEHQQHSPSPGRLPPSATHSPVSSAGHFASPGRDGGHHRSLPHPERKPGRLIYQYSDPGYPAPPPPPVRQWRRLSSSSELHEQHHQQRPGSGGFPDPPEELLAVYEEERPTDTASYHGYPNPVPGEGEVTSPKKRFAQPVVLYHSPLHPGNSGVTETVTVRPLSSSSSSPYARSTLPNMTSQPNRHSLLHSQQQKPQHQTFPRQQASYLASSMHAYVTCE
ncbi:uncharacterized protein LOC143294415 [Babylonia areolata]|uniref:uncharacterized protein LOC143294415 n=1 Tax=Babylonia areolata TaxID=304850 RepID=UPI003FD1AF97